MDRSSRVRVSGPLAGLASRFREQLAALGYAPSSAAAHLLLMAHLSRWLDGSGLSPGLLTPRRLDEFLRSNRALGHRFPRSAKGLVPLLSYLRDAGVVPPQPAVVCSSSEELLDRFRLYLARERGLGGGTIVGYVHAAALFLKAVDHAGGRDLGRLSLTDVSGFLLAECGRRSVRSAKSVVSGLRAWLRFLHVADITPVSLSGCVPPVSGWSGTSLPRAMDPASVTALLRSCDRRTAKGRRDFAVLTVMARLGLRVSEVAALELGDIDWRGGQILVRGKASRVERLPLPVDVGQALADYVQHGRPPGEHRGLFLRMVAPHGAVTASALKVIVHAACARVGLPPLGAHRLRHTVASDLLRHGAGLPEIGQVLRHRSIAATAIYAKTDTMALRQLARPWPGGAA